MEATKRVQTKFLTFQVADGLDEALATSIQTFAEQKNADCLIAVEDEVTIRTLTRIDLREGMKTLQKLLQTDKALMLRPSCAPFPETFLREKMPRGVDNARILLRYGKEVEKILTKHAASISCKREQTKRLLHKTAEQSLEDGDITFMQYDILANNKEKYERRKRELIHNADLTEPFRYTFEKRDGLTGQIVPDGVKTEFVLTPLAGNTAVKQRHYYIYSDARGYGKTYFLSLLENRFNACFVNDVNNFFDVRQSAQLLLFDEMARSKCLSYANLKSLCMGKGCGINRKSHGASFRPREDVQVVICSNSSPFDLYGVWDNKSQRYVMTSSDYSTFAQRFFVVKLDGSVELDRLRVCDPFGMTEEDRRKALVCIVDGPLGNGSEGKLVKATVVRERLEEAVAFCIQLRKRKSPLYSSMYEMFQFLDHAVPVEGGLSWYDVGKAFWYDNGVRKRGQQQEMLKAVVEWMPTTERPTIAWIEERVKDKSPRELLTWLHTNGNYHFALADYYKRELAGEEPRSDLDLRQRCLKIHGYGSDNQTIYTLCIWPLVSDLLKEFKRLEWSDDED